MKALLLHGRAVAVILEVQVLGEVSRVYAVGHELGCKHLRTRSGLLDRVDIGTVACNDTDISIAIVIEFLHRYDARHRIDAINNALEVHDSPKTWEFAINWHYSPHSSACPSTHLTNQNHVGKRTRARLSARIPTMTVTAFVKDSPSNCGEAMGRTLRRLRVRRS